MKINFSFGGSPTRRNKANSLKKINKIKKSQTGNQNLTKNLTNKNNCEQPIKSAFDELEELIGLENIKTLLNELRAYVYIKKARQREGLITDSMVLHMIFKGNPGTGKTTIARILAKFFKEVGILQKGHLVEVERADLVGEYIGHTAQRTREKIKKALGGILFIDEAYSLARGGERDFGREAIDCLVKGMEDHREELILILAGYKDEMENFIRTNPGLISRFPIHLNFPDYNLEELMNIAKLMLAKREYQLTLEAELKLEKILRKIIFSGYNCNGNARLVRNIIEKSIRRQACRLVENEENLNKQTLLEITADDIIEEKIPDLFENNWSTNTNQNLLKNL